MCSVTPATKLEATRIWLECRSKINVAVFLDMRKRAGISAAHTTIASPDYKNVRPRGVLPSELPERVVRRYLELMVNNQEVVASQGLGKRVRFAAQFPDVVGVSEAGKVGVLRRAVLSVRCGGVGVCPAGRSGACRGCQRRRLGLGLGHAARLHARDLPVRSSQRFLLWERLEPQGQHRRHGLVNT